VSVLRQDDVTDGPPESRREETCRATEGLPSG
jgi:hypothetical protein